MANGFYLNGQYYLIPEEYQSFDDYFTYLQQLTFPTKQRLVWLQENHHVRCYTVFKGESIAPYFLSGYHDIPVEIIIPSLHDPIPVDVYVMDQDTYNAKLRDLISSYCPGCKRFKPLTNRVQSLNGHHEEISLDRVCFFRYDTNPSPRIFCDNLCIYGRFFRMFQYENSNAEQMRKNLASLYLRFASAQLHSDGDNKVLTLVCKKGELLAPLVTQLVARYTQAVVHRNYRITLQEPVAASEEYIRFLLSPEYSEAFRKECKKYGVSVMILNYTPGHRSDVERCLSELEKHYYLDPLSLHDGRHIYLATDTANVLKQIRYHSPLLEKLGATVDVFDQFKNTHYDISFQMHNTQI